MSAEIDEYPSLCFQDIRKKTKCHGRTDTRSDGQCENSITHHKFVCVCVGGGGGIINTPVQ